MSRPLVSVLLPTHNRSDVLRLALESARRQTVEDFEILVVADGCTDDTVEVVEAFDDPRLRLFDLPKAPHFGYANRNTALAEARGEFVAFLAHDDLWLDDHLERLLPAFDDAAVDWSYSQAIWVAPDGSCTPHPFDLEQPAIRDEFLADRLCVVVPSGLLYRRSCHQRFGMWNPAVTRAGEWEMLQRFMEHGAARNYRYWPWATALHFRAQWRAEDNAGPPSMELWPTLAPDEIPGLEPGSEGLEQRRFLDAMDRLGRRWPESFRAAVARRIEAHTQQLLAGDAGEPALAASHRRLRDEHLALRMQFEAALAENGHGSVRFGPGCYADEGGWRWLGPQASLVVVSPAGARLDLEVSVGPDPGRYDRFPLAVNVAADSGESATVTLDHERPTQRVTLTTRGGGTHDAVRFTSGGSFRPSGGDRRRLAIALRVLEVVESSSEER